MLADHGSWSLGVLFGLPVLILLTAATVALGGWLYSKYNDEKTYDPGIFRAGAIGSWALALILVIGILFGYYPYKAEYHQWREVSGTVHKVNKRILSDGSGNMQQKYVVQYEESPGRAFGCEDTRCALVDVGDTLTMKCKRVWQYSGSDGWDCNYIGRKGN